jgi:hypothetical protein
MLNGIDPILIFHFSKSPPSSEGTEKITTAKSGSENIPLPPIPIYLSRQLTGLVISSEEKNVDIESTTDAQISNGKVVVNQKPIGTVIKVTMLANSGSIGVTILSAVSDLIVEKVVAKEATITYLHNATTIFGGLLHSFSIAQGSDKTLYTITLEICKAANETVEPEGTKSLTPDAEAKTLSGSEAPMAKIQNFQGPVSRPPSQAPIQMGGFN